MVDKILEKQKKKDWGQYFTPLEVVYFMYQMVKVFLPKRIHRFIKIIDPACGEGVFLKYALENKITTRVNLFGCDIDPKIESEWKKFDIFGKLHLYIWDGLLDEEEGIKRNSFDLVIGNPPYGGTGLAELGRLLKVKEFRNVIRDQKMMNLFGEEEPLLTKRKVSYEIDLRADLFSRREESDLIKLANSLYYDYESWKKESFQTEIEEGEEQFSFENMQKVEPGKKRIEYIQNMMYDQIRRDKNLSLPSKDIKKLMTFPIEILFTERFLQLAKPGGLIAIILPEGIFANAQTQYFRDWLLQKGSPLAIVSLPRKVFASAGANAKTTILFMKKRVPGEALKDSARKKVLLTSSNQGNGNNVDLGKYFEEVLDAAKKMRR